MSHDSEPDLPVLPAPNQQPVLTTLRLVEPAPPAPPIKATDESSLDDSELLGALRASDPAAATALYERAHECVDRTIFRLLGRRDTDHADLAQLAMIELINTIHRFRGECSLDTWISTVTAHAVYKRLRRRKTERRIFCTDPISEVPASRTSPTRVMQLRSAVARVMELLDEMNEERAWTFVLHDIGGHDLQEIARITRVSVAAAQSRLVRARKELHARIADDPELARVLEEDGS